MDVVFIVAVIVVAIVVLAASPMTRRTGDAVDKQSRAEVDVDRQFRRPPNEGDLL